MKLVPARLSHLHPGSIICADASIPCIAPGPHTVFESHNENLCVFCSVGNHQLNGQLDFDDHDTLVGLWTWTETDA